MQRYSISILAVARPVVLRDTGSLSLGYTRSHLLQSVTQGENLLALKSYCCRLPAGLLLTTFSILLFFLLIGIIILTTVTEQLCRWPLRRCTTLSAVTPRRAEVTEGGKGAVQSIRGNVYGNGVGIDVSNVAGMANDACAVRWTGGSFYWYTRSTGWHRTCLGG